MRMSIRAINDDGRGFELDVEGAVNCSLRVRPAVAGSAAVAQPAGPDAAAIAEAEAAFAHLLPENQS